MRSSVFITEAPNSWSSANFTSPPSPQVCAGRPSMKNNHVRVAAVEHSSCLRHGHLPRSHLTLTLVCYNSPRELRRFPLEWPLVYLEWSRKARAFLWLVPLAAAHQEPAPCRSVCAENFVTPLF